MTIASPPLLLHLHIVGVLLAALVPVNIYVPVRYRWREEMAGLSLFNRQVFLAHAIFIALTVGLVAALLLTDADALLEPTRLSRAVLAGLTLFWTLRMVMQWAFYSPAIWRGHRFNTAMHLVFSALWIYVSCVFALAFWSVSH